MQKKLGLLTAIVAASCFSAFSQASTNQPDALMLRFPDISQDKVVFSYAENLWVVPRSGGVARQITNSEGMEFAPKFSPDGSTIAFTGNYDGNNDVYTLPAEGGVPSRVTYHPGTDWVEDWHPKEDKIMFSSSRESPSGRFEQFYLVDSKGGLPKKMPFFYIEWGSFSPDGTKLAYQYLDRTFRNWKRYQGGTASDLWIHDYSTNKSEKITKYPGSDDIPMWFGNKVYFISDRGEAAKMNIWSYDVGTKAFNQETKFTEYDVKFPSAGPNEIIFENGGALKTFSIGNGEIKEISVTIPTDLTSTRPTIKDMSKNILWYEISPTGKRAIFSARGDILTVPAEHGPTYNYTQSSGVAERAPWWSPDGKSIAYFSDEGGEYELYTMNADRSGKPRKITSGNKTYFYQAVWSPDSKKLALLAKDGQISIIDVSSGKQTMVYRMVNYPNNNYSWSPDSRYLAFRKQNPRANYQIACWDTRDNKMIELTSGFYNDFDPVFSRDGKYLYYTSNRHFSPIYSDMDWAFVYPNSTKLMAVPLSRDTPPLLAPRNDDEEQKKEEPSSSSKGKKDKKSKDEDAAENTGVKVRLDADGFESRGEILPVDAGNYNNLIAADGKVLFMEFPLAGTAKPGAPNGTLKYYDVKERKAETIISGINGYVVSGDGKKVMYSSRGSYGIIDPAKGKKVGDGKVDLSGMKFQVDPKEEWKQIYNEAWRIQRDFFYDPDLHQVDWAGMRARYEKLLPYATSRNDLNYIIGELFAELNVGHAYNGGGDIKRAKRVGVGLLGVDFEMDAAKNAYKIAKIYRAADWDPQFASPLAAPNLKVKEGDYIHAVNGLSLSTDQDPWAPFQGLNGKTVSLSISSSGSMSDSKEILVKTLSSESRIRNQAWVEENRKKVYDATDGKIGYIYVPNTGRGGQNELMKMFQGQYRLEGLIIDERFNSGGQVPDRFIEILNRKILSYWARRDRKTDPSPFVINNGPKVMLANEWAGSGGDAFPYFFQKAEVGPVVGKRTWGGLVGYSGGWPSIIDGGFMTSPNFGIFNTEGKWDVEGYGVDPDYEVENPADAVFRGEDAQLDKAIELILKALEDFPKAPEKPNGPDRRGIGIGE